MQQKMQGPRKTGPSSGSDVRLRSFILSVYLTLRERTNETERTCGYNWALSESAPN